VPLPALSGSAQVGRPVSSRPCVHGPVTSQERQVANLHAAKASRSLHRPNVGESANALFYRVRRCQRGYVDHCQRGPGNCIDESLLCSTRTPDLDQIRLAQGAIYANPDLTPAARCWRKGAHCEQRVIRVGLGAPALSDRRVAPCQRDGKAAT